MDIQSLNPTAIMLLKTAERLLDAILAYRMTRMSQRCAQVWSVVEAQEQLGDIRCLVVLVVI